LGIVEADDHADRIRPAPMRGHQRVLDLGLADASDDDLAAGIDDLISRLQHEVDALLVHEAGDQAENRSARYRKPELTADIVGVGLLAFPVAGGEWLGELRAVARVP